MEVKIKNNNKMIDATIEIVDGVMVVSPKGKLFEPENGDVVTSKDGVHIYLCKDYLGEGYIYAYKGYDFNIGAWYHEGEWFVERYATEEEKKKLLDKLKEGGYEWDSKRRKLVDLEWKPKNNENYWSPSFYDSEFITRMYYWQDSRSGNKKLGKGWVFRTEEECQKLCEKLNEAINQVKP